MLNKIWPFFIIISFTYAIFSGNIEKLNNSIFESCGDAVELSITFLGTMCLWSGIMNIVKKTSLMEKIKFALKPIVKFLFPDLSKENSAENEISMNIVANILGLGNAATPLGLKAMEKLQKENTKKDTISNSMAMFIVINTASIQIIPTTVIAIRTSLNSENPSRVIFPIWIATIISALTAVILTKILQKNIKRVVKK